MSSSIMRAIRGDFNLTSVSDARTSLKSRTYKKNRSGSVGPTRRYKRYLELREKNKKKPDYAKDTPRVSAPLIDEADAPQIEEDSDIPSLEEWNMMYCRYWDDWDEMFWENERRLFNDSVC